MRPETDMGQHTTSNVAGAAVEPRVVRRHDFAGHELHGSGSLRRAIYPDTVGSRRLFVGVAEFDPGTAPHVWHRHATETVGGRELSYASDFEEFYFVVDGSGEMQWRFEDGKRRSVPVSSGDAVYFPPGVVEHRIFNTGPVRMTVLYGGTPPAAVRNLA
jgi:mannose-6-phosphate isomerase-like protein (cupin superfamily)